MMLKNHLLLGIAGFITYKEAVYDGRWYTESAAALEFLFVLLGVVLPDIDYPNSFIGKRLKWASYPIWAFFGHRGLMHSLWPVFILFVLGGHYELPPLYFIALGAALHLLGDYLTPAGIPVLYPKKWNYRAPLTVQTDGWGEQVVGMVAIVGALMFVMGVI